MKHLLFLIAGLLLSCTAVCAQDFITMRNGDKITAKVLEITPSEVKYKKFDNIDSLIYIEPKWNIVSIKYENGNEDVFYVSSIETTAKRDTQSTSKLTLTGDFWGYKFVVDGRKKDISTIMQEQGADKAYRLYRQGRQQEMAGGIMALSATLVFGLVLYGTLADEKSNYDYILGDFIYTVGRIMEITVLVCSGADILLGVILLCVGNHDVKKSWKLYQAKFNAQTSSVNLDFGIAQHGIGLCLKF